MKKVLFTATVDSHILQFHLPFLKLFKDKGYEVHVATNGNEEIPYCDKKHVICFERSPIKLNNLKAIKNLRKIINEEKFDIIHCHTPMGSVVTRLAATKARRKYHTRVIYTAHGFHFYKGASLKNWLIFYPVEKYLAKYTDTLITINKEDYELAKKKFSKRCKNIEYVPGVGIDEEKFNFKMTKKEKTELRKSLGLKDSDFVLTCVARLDKNKNQGFLIGVMEQLVKEHSNIHLLLVGPDELDGKYQKMVKDKNLEDNIHFLGYRSDIPQLLKITNVSVSASLREGLPVNILEAMASGIPVVAIDARGVRDLIEDGKNGYVITNNKDEFIDKVIKLFTNKDLYNKISKNNFKDIKQYYLDNIVNIMSDIYYKKKKILHILASNQYSGAENVVCTIINNMKDEYDMVYCSPNGPIRDMLKEKNINYYPLRKLSINELRKVVKLFNPDIIHAHDNKATVLSSFFQKKCKLISHIHGNNRIMNNLNLKTILFNFCSKKIDKIIWVSDSSLNDYYFKEKIKNKSIVLYNVVDKENILKKAKEYICKEKYDLIFLGRLGYPKNPERFIEIVKILSQKKSDIKVAMVGDGPDRNNVEKMIDNYNLRSNIKMYGYQSNPFPILYNSKILVMTSIYEGTPMCALEAQALGKPIVATKVDGLIDIVKNDLNGFLSNSDDELENKILCLISDEKEYNKFVFYTKEKFADFNNINNYIDRIKSIYKI